MGLDRWAILRRTLPGILAVAALWGGSSGLGAQATVTPRAMGAVPSLAPLPPMGWANWNRYFCDYDAETIRRQADALVSTGMRDLGYRYVIIQECIAPSRDASGRLVVDAKRFPDGIRPLVDYIHARGLKAGIYTDVGRWTCFPEPRYQGSFGHELQDATTFASWGIDLVEMDYCNRPPGNTGREIYERMGRALRSSGRPIVFYICSWGNERPWEWAQGFAQLWRTDADISLQKNHAAWDHVVRNFESNARDSDFTAPNSWNDPDMLEVGMPGLNATEAQTHFSMWAMSGAPLWAAADLTHMDAATRDILTNREAVAVDQDPLGAGIEKVSGADDGLQVWARRLGSVTRGERAVLLLNLGSAPATASVRWSELGLLGSARVRDLWLHRELGEFADGFTAEIPAHGSRLLRVAGPFDWARGAVVEAEWPANGRTGEAQLLVCGECSRGFAVRLGGGGTLSLNRLDVPAEGEYTLDLSYVRNGLADQTLSVRVNSTHAIHVTAPAGEVNRVAIPVQLHAGSNTVAFSCAAGESLDIDRIRIRR